MRSLARVLLSGGMDSALCLAWACDTFIDVDAVAFDYGQRHSKELDRARAIADLMRVPMTVRKVRFLKGALVGDGDDLSAEGAVVKGRNQAFLLGALTPAPPPAVLIMGACLDDRAVFEDCRPEFFHEVQQGFHPKGIQILTPLIEQRKADIARELSKRAELLALTWSCYSGGEYPCGCCGACIARSAGFRLAGLDDPQPTDPRLAVECPFCTAKAGHYCYHPHHGFVGFHKERRA